MKNYFLRCFTLGLSGGERFKVNGDFFLICRQANWFASHNKIWSIALGDLGTMDVTAAKISARISGS